MSGNKFYGDHTLSDVEERKLNYDLFVPSISSINREKVIMNHVLKCFTFGKPVRRDTPDDSQPHESRIEEIKKKFNRIFLIRRFMSKKR